MTTFLSPSIIHLGNAEQVHLNFKLQNLKKLFILLLAIPFVAFLFINLKELSHKWLLLLAISFLLSVTPKLDKIHHKCFEYFNGRLTTKEQPDDTVETIRLKQEFIKQFNLK